jgi:putative hydroxymethylpyrimidine transport system substrate-binding protein
VHVIGALRRGTIGAAAAFVAVALLVCGCGSAAAGGARHSAPRSASLVLDFTPNAIHAGIYEAIRAGYLRRAGVELHVIIPGASTDAISLLTAGRVDFAILDIHDLAIADEQGRHLVGIMAIVERPLASVIAQPAYPSPRDLDGKTVGVTGDPSDLAVLRSIVAGAGGRPSTVHTLTIGYDAVPDLLAHRVAAATAFWNDEGIQLEHDDPGFHIFRVERYGAPPYPELVVCATAASLRQDPELARGLVHGLVRGYQAVLRDPAAGEHALESAVPGLSRTEVTEQLHAELPAFLPSAGGGVGALDRSTLEAWARWEVRFGIVRRTPDIATMFTTRFLPRDS